MKKDNLIFGLGGTIVGVILGVLIANQTPQRIQTVPANQQAVAQPATSQPDQQNLPQGHPPIDESLVKQIAQQEEILKQDPENQAAIVAMANLYYDLKNYKEATRWYEKALVKEPGNINLITDVGTSYLQLNDFDKALNYYKKALSIDPKHYQTLMNIGIAKMAMGDKKGAADAWSKLVQYHPNDPNIGMIKNALQEMKAKG